MNRDGFAENHDRECCKSVIQRLSMASDISPTQDNEHAHIYFVQVVFSAS